MRFADTIAQIRNRDTGSGTGYDLTGSVYDAIKTAHSHFTVTAILTEGWMLQRTL